MSDRELLLKFIATLSLCDHMGDVGNAAARALRLIGEADLAAFGDWHELRRMLAARGITTLGGTGVWDEGCE